MKAHDLKPFKTADEIRKAVKSIALKISSDYSGKRPVLVCVLGGAFIFLADLARELTADVEIDFVKAGSYGHGTTPAHEPLLTLYPKLSLKGRDVIIVEDIIDTSATYMLVKGVIEGMGPASVSCCTLLYRKGVPVEVRYSCFEVGEGLFLVGYGLDYGEEHRALGGLYIMDNEG